MQLSPLFLSDPPSLGEAPPAARIINSGSYASSYALSSPSVLRGGNAANSYAHNTRMKQLLPLGLDSPDDDLRGPGLHLSGSLFVGPKNPREFNDHFLL